MKKITTICTFIVFIIFSFSACLNETTPSLRSLDIEAGTYSSILNKPFSCAYLEIKNSSNNSFEFILSIEGVADRVFEGVAKIKDNNSVLSYRSNGLEISFTMGDNYLNVATKGIDISDEEVELANSKFVLNKPSRITADEACNKVTEYWDYYPNYYDDQSDFYRGGTKYYTIIIDRGEKAVALLYVNSITGNIYNGNFDSEDEGKLTGTLND